LLKLPSGPWKVAICHISHMSALLVHREGFRLLVDPFFARGFWWESHWERQVEAPAFEIEELDRCDAILVSHDHPDHYDEWAVDYLIRQAGAKLLCPDIVKTDALTRRNREGEVISMNAWQEEDIGAFRITALPNKGSEDKPFLDRISFLIEVEDLGLFHSGDSNGASPSWKRHNIESVDLAMTISFFLEDFLQALKPRKLLLLDSGRFEPGRFMINADSERLRLELQPRYPETEILVPAHGEWVDLPTKTTHS